MTTVYKAISRGNWLLKYIPGLIMVVCIATSLALANLNQHLHENWFVTTLIVGFLVTIVLSWTWWSYWVVEWKIWAYREVEDIHLLYERGVTNRIIWPRGSIYEKTEFRFGKKKAILEKLEERFEIDRKQEMVVDENLPEEYIVGVTKQGLYGGIGGILVAAILPLIIPKLYVIAIFPLFFSAMGWWEYRKVRKRGNVFMKLNSDYIVIKGLEVYWDDIQSYSVEHEGYGSDQKTFLYLNAESEALVTNRINLKNAGISRRKLEYLMDVYHSRYMLSNEKEK